jgi:hypothetical protein
VALEQEIQVFRSHLHDLLGAGNVNEGRYAIVKGDVIAGPFEDYEAALAAAYERFGLGPFLVKKIETHDTVMFFARDIR